MQLSGEYTSIAASLSCRGPDISVRRIVILLFNFVFMQKHRHFLVFQKANLSPVASLSLSAPLPHALVVSFYLRCGLMAGLYFLCCVMLPHYLRCKNLHVFARYSFESEIVTKHREKIKKWHWKNNGRSQGINKIKGPGAVIIYHVKIG